MLGLLDADILPYEFGAAKTEDGDELPLGLTIARVHERIEKIQERSGVDKMKFYLTSTDKSNFRFKVATIVPYKGKRPVEKSKWWEAIRFEIKNNFNAEEVFGMEADDKLSIEQEKDYNLSKLMQETDRLSGGCDELSDYCGTMILSRDKDLNIRPGWHYGWEAGNCKEKPVWFQTEIGGLRMFYKQLLTGDSVDNILGLFGVGVKSALVSQLDDCNTESEMYVHVLKKYQDRFGAYAEQFLLENGRLLWMLRTEDDVWQLPKIDLPEMQQDV